jgi:glycosyltransferase involved in cell wall biosynthesis
VNPGETAAFTVIVAALSGAPGLGRLLAALEAQDFPRERFEVLLALAGGVPDEALATRVAALGGRVLAVDAARGTGAARNAAAAQARHEWLAITGPDCEPAPDWLSRIAARVSRGDAPDAIVGAVAPPGGQPAAARYDAANLFVRRDRFARVNGFHESFGTADFRPCWREDADLGFALEETNALVEYDPGALVTRHRERAAAWEPLRWAARHEFDARLARRHPRLFRERVGVRHMGPLRVRRPFLRAALGVALALALAVALIAAGRGPQAVPLLAIALLLQLVVWARWRFHPARLPAALLVPYVLAAALVRGQQRASGGAR